MYMRFRFELPWLSLWTGRIDDPELMDNQGIAPNIVRNNLNDLRRVNQWLGGVKLTIEGLERLTADLKPGDELTILDVATGAVDIPAQLIPWAERRGLKPRVVASDINPESLAIAAKETPQEINLAVADGRKLPFLDNSFDIVFCSLALHHLAPEDAVAMLSEMNRIARRGVVINDLVRCWHGYAGAWLFSRVGTPPGSLGRHDAPLSVRRAYTRKEMASLAKQAGFSRGVFDSFLGYRVAMTVTSSP
jgi:SAM-dependent methyltransferase